MQEKNKIYLSNEFVTTPLQEHKSVMGKIENFVLLNNIKTIIKKELNMGCNPGAGSWNYTIQAGDTLAGIAGAFGCPNSTTANIQACNNISNPNQIYVGQVIAVSYWNYTVQSGDTIANIVQTYAITDQAQWLINNGVSNPNAIYVGQLLKIGN